MTFDIQSTLNLYASMPYCAFFLWIALAGFFAYICILMIFTKLSFQKLYQPLLRIYAVGLGIAYVITPIYLFLALKVISFFSDVMISSRDISFILAVMFVTTMHVIMRSLLCNTLVQSNCKKFSFALVICHILLLFSGFYVLMNAGLIQ